MINTNKAILALTSHADQLKHMHIAVDLANENTVIFSALKEINSAINREIKRKSNFADGVFSFGFALSSLIDEDIIGKYLGSVVGVSEVKIRHRPNAGAVVYNLKITA